MSKMIVTRKCDAFFKKLDKSGLANSYGDVRLKTRYSDVLPNETILISRFSRDVKLNIPIVSSPMDKVTEYKMAKALALIGGLGVIHKALSPKEQARQVSKVKHYLHAFIPDPICVSTNDTVEHVINMQKEKDRNFLSFPVKNKLGRVVGLVASNDFDFCSDPKSRISEIMSKKIIKADENTTVEIAYEKMIKTRKKILPVFYANGNLKGIYTWKDVKRITNKESGDFNLDANGCLVVGAAVGLGDDLEERLELLSRNNVDVIVIDTAHGNTRKMVETIKFCKKNYPHINFVAGNISEGDAAKRLVRAGVDGLRVGQGPGSICTTRVIAGIGCPQVTAIYNCASAIRNSGVPICGDGGIDYSGDITIALGAGADNVMLGNRLAGTTESPGEIIYKDGKAFKEYRGMGSLGAMTESRSNRDRYSQGGTSKDKLVPEGVEGLVPYKGDLDLVINQILGGLKSGMGYVGAKNILALQKRADFYLISSAGMAESRPHHLEFMKDSPNYHG